MNKIKIINCYQAKYKYVKKSVLTGIVFTIAKLNENGTHERFLSIPDVKSKETHFNSLVS